MGHPGEIMAARSIRSLTTIEETTIHDVLRKLREHFNGWTWFHDCELALMQFAYYEGCGHRWNCCLEILTEAAPFALGKELVSKHGFRWVMARSGRTWRYAVEHPALDRPVVLASLEDRPWDAEKYDSQPDPGRMTIDSLETIVAQIR